MRLIVSILLLLTITGCSGRNTVRRLQETKWGNSAHPCSEVYATFDKGVIASHANGQTLPFFEIVRITPSWWSPNDVAVRVKPPAKIERTLPSRMQTQMHDFYERGFELNLHLDEKRMWIKSISVGGEQKPVRGDMTMFNMFDCEHLT